MWQNSKLIEDTLASLIKKRIVKEKDNRYVLVF